MIYSKKHFLKFNLFIVLSISLFLVMLSCDDEYDIKNLPKTRTKMALSGCEKSFMVKVKSHNDLNTLKEYSKSQNMSLNEAIIELVFEGDVTNYVEFGIVKLNEKGNYIFVDGWDIPLQIIPDKNSITIMASNGLKREYVFETVDEVPSDDIEQNENKSDEQENNDR